MCQDQFCRTVPAMGPQGENQLHWKTHSARQKRNSAHKIAVFGTTNQGISITGTQQMCP